ncbi:MAG TPA: alcohol dehydrogenase catalytic domain-containing protein [candidate division Zixibacteria bacterium]|nr:alcohol dehydrogenase catalytic domain-containing protein [candidate division Zixibacteria bacterium]
MKQQIVTSTRKIEFREISIPEYKENEVLIKIMRIGICGSDIHVFYGKHPSTPFPVTQGHEVSGEIIEIGNKVDKFKPGDKVTIQPQVVCGKCFSCLKGNYHICENLKVMGFQTTGTASEYFVTSEDLLIKLPDKMTFDQGAMVEPVAVACSALRKVDNIKDMKIVIIGGGPIGNLTAQAAKAMGAESVLITEINDFRLKLAKKVGIDYTVNTRDKNLSEEITKAFGLDKADLIIECVGFENTVEEAISNARKGTDIILVGVFGETPKVDLNLVQNHELRLIGTLMYKKEDYLKAIDLIQSERILVEPLITNHFSFLDYEKAYDFIEKNKEKVMKVMIDVN